MNVLPFPHKPDRRDIVAAMAAELRQAEVTTEDAAMRVLLHARFRGGDIIALLGEAIYEAQLLGVSEAVA